jgi:glycerate 2-kinase
MATGALECVGHQVCRGLVIAPSDVHIDSRLESVRGDHPMPSLNSERAGRAALELARSQDDAVVLLVLLSGGASALMAAPARGISLGDKQQTTDRLLRQGVTITELNAVRKHLSAVKGGRLAAASTVPLTTLAISDVVGDDPAVIGSGPTVADTSTFADALAIVTRAGGSGAFPPAVLKRLREGVEGRINETPKPGDPRLARSHWMLIGGRADAMNAAAAEARRQGYEVQIRSEPVVGEAREAAAEWLPWLLESIRRRPGGVCLISSGETTVRVTGSGLGGRNQEFALALAQPLAKIGRAVALASVGTDGVDGPTDAAGAIVSSETMSKAHQIGLGEPDAYLANNDAYHFFETLSDLVQTGPTGTNVGDLQVCLIGPGS